MSQYIQFLLSFVVNNRAHFMINSEIHNINTRNSSNLHFPLENLDIFQRGAYHSGITIVFLLTLKNFVIIQGH